MQKPRGGTRPQLTSDIAAKPGPPPDHGRPPRAALLKGRRRRGSSRPRWTRSWPRPLTSPRDHRHLPALPADIRAPPSPPRQDAPHPRRPATTAKGSRYVDRSQCEPRARLTEAHEIGPQIIPWHQASLPARRRGTPARHPPATSSRHEAYLAGGQPDLPGAQHFLSSMPWTTTSPSPPQSPSPRTTSASPARHDPLLHPCTTPNRCGAPDRWPAGIRL